LECSLELGRSGVDSELSATAWVLRTNGRGTTRSSLRFSIQVDSRGVTAVLFRALTVYKLGSELLSYLCYCTAYPYVRTSKM
jgi:hypothetical protein